MLNKHILDGRFTYCPDSGLLFHKERGRDEFKNNGSYCGHLLKVGTPAGSIGSNGYVGTNMTIDGIRRRYSVHRLIWMMWYGYKPTQIDHINGIRSDNRITNLREVTLSDNQRNRTLGRNSTTGEIGIYWCERDKAYNVYLAGTYGGYFKSLGDAVESRDNLLIRLGFHELHGTNKL